MNIDLTETLMYPSNVNLIAFVIRLMMTCLILLWSLVNLSNSRKSTSEISLSPLFLACMVRIAQALSKVSFILNDSILS
jgi:hypothetical protein